MGEDFWDMQNTTEYSKKNAYLINSRSTSRLKNNNNKTKINCKLKRNVCLLSVLKLELWIKVDFIRTRPS